jgi:hypothetical protein
MIPDGELFVICFWLIGIKTGLKLHHLLKTITIRGSFNASRFWMPVEDPVLTDCVAIVITLHIHHFVIPGLTRGSTGSPRVKPGMTDRN